MSLRIGLGVLLLYWVAMRLVKAVLVEDQPGGDAPAAVNRRNRLAGWLLALYVVVLSLWGFDLLMSLDPRWYSGLFGGYYVVTSMYTGFGLVTYLTIRSNERGLTRVAPSAIQDVAKLTFALSVFWMYFFFSQYLVIWYGNVPAETRFVIRRFFAQPWGTIAWVIFIIGWLIPFSYLLKRLTGRPPERHRVFKVILFFGWIAIFFERMLLVFPSLLRDNTVPLGPVEILVTLGFFSLFVLSRNWFLAHYKPVLEPAQVAASARPRPAVEYRRDLRRGSARPHPVARGRARRRAGPAHRAPAPRARGGRGQPARHAAVAGLLDGRLRPPQRRHRRRRARRPRAPAPGRPRARGGDGGAAAAGGRGLPDLHGRAAARGRGRGHSPGGRDGGGGRAARPAAGRRRRLRAARAART